MAVKTTGENPVNQCKALKQILAHANVPLCATTGVSAGLQAALGSLQISDLLLLSGAKSSREVLGECL